jgi:hypothetical protein
VSLQGGVRQDIQNNVVGADTAALTAAQAQAESGERRRRELAPATPGVGTVLPLPSVLPAGPSVGRDPAGWPAVGGGYDQTAEISATDQKAYGPARPVYADPFVGGIGFVAGRQEPAVRHVVNLGADGLFIEDRPVPAGDVVTVASAPPRPDLLSRARAALGGVRGRR